MTDIQRAELRGMQAAADAVGREIARVRDAGASDTELRAIHRALAAINATAADYMELLGFDVTKEG